MLFHTLQLHYKVNNNNVKNIQLLLTVVIARTSDVVLGQKSFNCCWASVGVVGDILQSRKNRKGSLSSYSEVICISLPAIKIVYLFSPLNKSENTFWNTTFLYLLIASKPSNQ